MKNVHVLLVPYPAQGHVLPLMELAQCLTSNGVKVTFANTEATHERVMNSWSKRDGVMSDLMQFVGISDGMEQGDDRNDIGKLTETMFRIMPAKLEELIVGINNTNDDRITCIVSDYAMGWVTRVARKLGIRNGLFCATSSVVMALVMSIQKLMDDEVIDNNGVPLKDRIVQLSTTTPPMDPRKFPWVCIGDSQMNKICFHTAFVAVKEAAEAADCIICNSNMELEHGTFALFPKMTPIGPLFATNKLTKQIGHFWNEDTTCLTWLNQQPAKSVIYVAFGSFTVFDQRQFEELALGLELTNKPFLWVVRQGTSGHTDYIFPNGYMDRVGTRGKIVSWAPQQEVLSHPSVACFMSHCGWNSIQEGVTNGIPFLCWPYFADQFVVTTYLVEFWKTGLGFDKDDNGIVARGEIKSKVEQLLNDKMIKQNVLSLQEKVMESARSGNSSKNLHSFIEWVKGGNGIAPSLS